MKSSAIFMLASAAVGQAIQQCSGTPKEEGGNWFCGAVEQISYLNVGGPGTYKAVSQMNEDGFCNFEDVAFSGALAPFNEELVPVFRGPMNLKQVAVYNLSPKAKRSPAVSHTHAHARRHGQHGHQHLHKKQVEEEPKEKRGEDWVVANIDNQVVSWINNYHGPTPVGPAPVVPTPTPTPTPSQPPVAAAAVPQPGGSKDSSPKAADSHSGSVNGGYTRVGYYNADNATADGIVFLGNYGGQGSGKFDNVFGNSLSYLNAEGTGGAASPQVLKPVTLKSNQEFLIASDKPCDDDDDLDNSCGYYRNGSVAYHGFKGFDSVWLFELNMPLDGTTGFNADMSALWILNARIPRTAQYSVCSCWPGCGELDILEVLSPGDSKCKSTVHSINSGGSSDYFHRPTGPPVKIAVVLDAESSQVSLKMLDSNVEFGTGISRSQVESWLSADSVSTASTDGQSNKVSLFSLSS
ncbi:hypothetical protein CORC01_07236 [Colletotrichum orchidophilum]|uniref:glucan endo-1,3-beta-D-glucosidase n=1 Tax=Colletotrichum orchidophilum TaxID=1209926 RepID=A0A1G4B7T7_9PEZI|nr:uncharacterized protein CORC01_07236 [Colletotrichum orchidophilum]OHE97454.1 hypothetical protein CORC01_07236 [Colletotrichum orchidophilum]